MPGLLTSSDSSLWNVGKPWGWIKGFRGVSAAVHCVGMATPLPALLQRPSCMGGTVGGTPFLFLQCLFSHAFSSHLHQVTLSKWTVFPRSLSFRWYVLFSPWVASVDPLKVRRQASLCPIIGEESLARLGLLTGDCTDPLPTSICETRKLPEWRQKPRCVGSDLSPPVAWHL